MGNGENMAFLGGAGIGKSSLLLHLVGRSSELINTTELAFVHHVDMVEMGSPRNSAFFRDVNSALVAHCASPDVGLPGINQLGIDLDSHSGLLVLLRALVNSGLPLSVTVVIDNLLEAYVIEKEYLAITTGLRAVVDQGPDRIPFQVVVAAPWRFVRSESGRISSGLADTMEHHILPAWSETEFRMCMESVVKPALGWDFPAWLSEAMFRETGGHPALSKRLAFATWKELSQKSDLRASYGAAAKLIRTEARAEFAKWSEELDSAALEYIEYVASNPNKTPVPVEKEITDQLTAIGALRMGESYDITQTCGAFLDFVDQEKSYRHPRYVRGVSRGALSTLMAFLADELGTDLLERLSYSSSRVFDRVLSNALKRSGYRTLKLPTPPNEPWSPAHMMTEHDIVVLGSRSRASSCADCIRGAINKAVKYADKAVVVHVTYCENEIREKCPEEVSALNWIVAERQGGISWFGGKTRGQSKLGWKH